MCSWALKCCEDIHDQVLNQFYFIMLPFGSDTISYQDELSLIVLVLWSLGCVLDDDWVWNVTRFEANMMHGP